MTTSSTFTIGLGFAYLVYTIFAALAFLFVWRAVTQTKGRALESM